MNSYFLVFGVIVMLAVINYGCLLWILSLQKQLRKLHQATPPPPSAMPKLQHEQVERLNAKLAAEAEAAVRKASAEFQEQLKTTLARVGQNVQDLSDKVVQDELTKYQGALDEVRQTSIDTLSEVQQAVDKRRAEMEKTLAAEVAEEKQRLVDAFGRHMGEIVSAYLMEALGTGVDLGAQSEYVIKTLEEHKEEIKKAMLS